MEPVRTTETVLDTPLEGQSVEANTPATEPKPSPSAAAAPQDTPTPDARVASLEQTIRQLDGRLAKAEDPASALRLENQIERLRRQQERLAIKLDPTITEAETATQLAALDAEEKAATATAERVTYAKKVAVRIVEDLDFAGISRDHPRVKEALEEWKSAQAHDDFDAVETRIRAFIRTEKAAAAKRSDADAQKQAEDARKEKNRTDAVMALGGNHSTPAAPNRTPTLAELHKVDTRRLTPRQVREHAAALDAAIQREILKRG